MFHYLKSKGEAQELLARFKIDKDQALQVLEVFRSENINGGNNSKKPKLLAKFTRNLTDLARADKLDPVIGRDTEIMRMMQILSRRTKNNPILIGEAGTGKTAVVEGLAQRIAKGDVPESLPCRCAINLRSPQQLLGNGLQPRHQHDHGKGKLAPNVDHDQ